MGSPKITQEARDRVDRDMQFLEDEGAEVMSKGNGRYYVVHYKGEQAFYWPYNNSFKVWVSKGRTKTHVCLRMDDPPRKMLREMSRIAEKNNGKGKA